MVVLEAQEHRWPQKSLCVIFPDISIHKKTRTEK